MNVRVMGALYLMASVGIGARAVAQRMGYTYLVRVTSEQIAHGSAAAGGQGRAPAYTARAMVLGDRGRLDIISVGADSVFHAGDYLLFDSAGMTVVHPERHEVIHIARDTSSDSASFASMDMKLSLSEERVVLDSLGPSDTVAGVPTRHYRLTVAFNLSLDGAMLHQRVATESVTDYWAAVIPDMRANPLLRVNALEMGRSTLFGGIAARVDSAAARMGQAVALRSRSTTRVTTAPGASVETRETMEVSDLRRATVDESLLKPPAGYNGVRSPD